MWRRIIGSLVMTGALIAAASGAAIAAPNVVVSVGPVHSLVAAVMRGIGTPDLLLTGGSSPHTYAMRPSDARLLADADVVVWVGAALEAFMAKPIESLARDARVVTLSEDAGLVLLPPRKGGAWQEHAGDTHDHDHGARHDAHVWLDPDNARRIVGHVARILAEADPANAGRYAANAASAAAEIATLDAELRATLVPVTDIGYVVFHDAYQYLEAHYGLKALGSITVSPARRPGARRLHEMRQTIVEMKAVCVFSEPQFEPALVKTIVEGTRARTGTLDPLGAAVPPGPEAYAATMRNLARSLETCLSPGSRAGAGR